MIRERTSYALCFNNVLTNMFHGSPIDPRIIDDWIHGISNELQDELTPAEALKMLNERQKPIYGECLRIIVDYNKGCSVIGVWKKGYLYSVDVRGLDPEYGSGEYFDVITGTIEMKSERFRIPVEPKWRPLKPEELVTLAGKCLWHKKKFTCQVLVIDPEEDRVILAGASSVNANAQQLFDEYTHLDGSPVGIKE